VIWGVIQNSNSFIVKRNGVKFSSEPNNVKNLNTYRYSGLVNPQTIGLTAPSSASRTGDVILTVKNRSLRKPKIALKRIPLVKKDAKKINFRKVARSVTNINKKYRPDLRKAVLARWTKLHRSIKTAKIKKVVVKKAAASTSTSDASKKSKN